MVRAVEGEEKFHCIRCGMESLNDSVPGVCSSLKWVKDNQERCRNARHLCKDKFMVGYLQRIIDVRKCRRCAGWASENR